MKKEDKILILILGAWTVYALLMLSGNGRWRIIVGGLIMYIAGMEVMKLKSKP
jgi:hypothetical protein